MDTANAKCTERLPLQLIIKTMTATLAGSLVFVFPHWVPQKAIVTLKHPLTVFTERSLQCWHLFFRRTTCLVKNPYLLICSPRVRRSLNLVWWICLGRQCCAERDKSMFLYLQLRRKCRLLCFQQQPPQLDWSTVTFPLMSSGPCWQQVDVCVLWLFVKCKRECDFHSLWLFSGGWGDRDKMM